MGEWAKQRGKFHERPHEPLAAHPLVEINRPKRRLGSKIGGLITNSKRGGSGGSGRHLDHDEEAFMCGGRDGSYK
jgi:hypothetical protein